MTAKLWKTISTVLMACLTLLNWSMICPHPQPFSPGRREPELLFPLPGKRARVRANFDIHISFSNAACLSFLSTLAYVMHKGVLDCAVGIFEWAVA